MAAPALRLASLAMYVDPPAIRSATKELWAYLRDALRDAGVQEVPDALDDDIAHDAAWLDPRLLLSQTCGYPYAKHLRGKVRLVATPAYALPGNEGPLNGSFVVVNASSPARFIEGLRGRRVAINDPGSNSGTNLLRAMVAPLAQGGRFFGEVVRTGGHVASLDAVATGRADVAAIDCVTYGNIARHQPERLADIRILAETAKTPGLPLITRGDATADELAALRHALDRFAEDPAVAGPREILAITGFHPLPDAAYDRVLELEAQAAALGYPVIR